MARHVEVEQKFDLDPESAFPDLATVAGVATVTGPVESSLEATYYDTPGLALARHGVTLRRRTGGSDAGWHLKLRLAPDERVEVRCPIDATRSDGVVPAELTDEVRALVRDQPLAPVAVVRTQRRERHLLAPDGTDLAVVADDVVAAERLLGDTVEQRCWREVEVELVDGDRAVLVAAARVLRDQGVTPSPSTSKLARAVGELAEPGTTELPAGSAGAQLTAYLRMHVEELLARDRGARAADPESVHKMRVATRRLRSALATYRPLVDRSVTDPLRDELRALGAQLGGVRDLQVQRERMLARLETQPADLVLGPVRRRMQLELRRRERAALRRLRAALDEPRYFRLLDALDALVTGPPLTPVAFDDAATAQPWLVGRSVRRVRRAAAAVADAPSGQRAERLHELRKAAKRARYAAESATEVVGKPARRLAKRMTSVQETLGEHQDSVTARDLLRELAVVAHGAGENGFTYGLLRAEEEACSRAAQAAYPDLLRHALSRKATRWTR